MSTTTVEQDLLSIQSVIDYRVADAKRAIKQQADEIRARIERDYLEYRGQSFWRWTDGNDGVYMRRLESLGINPEFLTATISYPQFQFREAGNRVLIQLDSNGVLVKVDLPRIVWVWLKSTPLIKWPLRFAIAFWYGERGRREG